MIDYIVYSEFDINEGSLVKIEYPNKIGIEEITLSSYMIPEGIHNTKTDNFCFIINKNNKGDEIILQEIKKTENDFLNNRTVKYLDFQYSQIYKDNIDNKSFIIKNIYNFNSSTNDWETLQITESYIKENKKIYIKISQNEKEKYFKLMVFIMNNENDINNIDIIFEMPIHSEVKFQKIKNNFASLNTLNNKAIGFEFISEDDLSIISELFNDNENIKKIYCTTEEYYTNNLFKNSTNIINKDNDIYFLCLAQTKLDKSSKRGAILKSIAIGTTKLINLNSFKTSCEYLIDQAFKIHNFNITSEEKIEKMRIEIEKIYNNFNSLKFNFGINKTRFERIVHAYLKGNNYFTLPNINEEKIIISENEIIKIDMNLSDNEEKIFQGSIIELIKIFKESVMTIYDGILNDQKIIFLGGPSTSCKLLSSLIFGCLCMFGPLSFGFIKRLFPYKNLYDMDFLNIHNCIYGVTNPIFKTKTNSWDILCEVDTGKITINNNYNNISLNVNKESDNMFIKELIYKINNEHLSEYEVEKFFTYYTLHLLKISKDEYLTDDESLNNEINKQSKRKINMNNSNICIIEYEYEKFRSLISFNNTTFNILEKDINNLISKKNIGKDELNVIYSDIENFIYGGSFYIHLFLSLIICYTYDFELIFNGIFSKYSEIRKKVKNIYNILGNDSLGNVLLRKLNYVYLIKLNEIDYNILNENDY